MTVEELGKRCKVKDPSYASLSDFDAGLKFLDEHPEIKNNSAVFPSVSEQVEIVYRSRRSTNVSGFMAWIFGKGEEQRAKLAEFQAKHAAALTELAKRATEAKVAELETKEAPAKFERQVELEKETQKTTIAQQAAQRTTVAAEADIRKAQAEQAKIQVEGSKITTEQARLQLNIDQLAFDGAQVMQTTPEAYREKKIQDVQVEAKLTEARGRAEIDKQKLKDELQAKIDAALQYRAVTFEQAQKMLDDVLPLIERRWKIAEEKDSPSRDDRLKRIDKVIAGYDRFLDEFGKPAVQEDDRPGHGTGSVGSDDRGQPDGDHRGTDESLPHLGDGDS